MVELLCTPNADNGQIFLWIGLEIGLDPGEASSIFVQPYSHLVYLDCGSIHFVRVSRPLSARWRLVASSPIALRPGLSQEDRMRTKEMTKEEALPGLIPPLPIP